MVPENVRLNIAREAVSALGLLKSGSEHSIFALMDESFSRHPTAIATEYRNRAPQLSDDEKRSIGIAANGYLSHEAHGELTDKGLASPLTAHEVTLLRAMFSLRRTQVAIQAHDNEIQNVKYETLSTTCPWCSTHDGVIAKWNKAHVTPPQECTCDTGNYSLSLHIDWFADID